MGFLDALTVALGDGPPDWPFAVGTRVRVRVGYRWAGAKVMSHLRCGGLQVAHDEERDWDLDGWTYGWLDVRKKP